ncbi:lysoplasmalogenase TMEM86B [Alligator mississippiensis]|uniref:lysoplasmalogenase n=1 Tax=Alligator mississippiensis TaxID=8496 RepID=A0A151NKG1_ALLMI|nr:lysoplasmalogenase TMEM86B [Alligator mississippiensis]KYO37169.1 lysoplasmalogenase [Alligator mississippiensis]
MDILETDAHHRRKLAAEARGRTVRLLPFLVSCALYFGLWLPEPSWPSAVTKILPVLSLVLFIWSESNGSWTPYAQGIFWGLLCSCAGDICLVWPDLFLPGAGAFAIAHLCYLWALGLRPVRPVAFMLTAVVWTATLVCLKPCLDSPVLGCAGIYSALLLAAACRSLSRLPSPHWSPWLVACGFLLFAASDAILVFDRFCLPLPRARLVVMVTYYMAQSLIAASVVGEAIHWKDI